MKKKKRYSQNKSIINKIGILSIFISIFLVSIGYSAFREDLTIENIVATVEKIVNVRISDVTIHSASDSESYANSSSFSSSTFSTNIHLNDSTSWVKYSINITNIGNEEVGIRSYLENTLPNNLDYEIDGYTLGTALCDDDDSSVCTLNSSTTFYITIKYKEGVTINNPADYDVNLGMNYGVFYDVSYASGICSGNCPSKVLEGNNLHVSLTNFNIINIYMANLLILEGNSYTFNRNTGALVINNVTGNIRIDDLNYTRLLYIESTGSADKQYIDTLYKVKDNTTVIYDGMTISGDTAIFGYRRSKTATDIQKFAVQYISAHVYRSTYGNNEYPLDSTYIANSRYLFKMDSTSLYINNVPVTPFSSIANYTTSGNLYLLAMNTGGVAGNFGQNRIYSFKILEGSNLVKNFIPVLDQDDVPCLYETIGEDFYYNLGNGTFNYLRAIRYTFTNNINYLNSSNPQSNISSGDSYETTLVPISGRSLPNKIIVKSDGIAIYENINYTYNNQTGELIINEVTGNITIEEITIVELEYLASSGIQYIKTGYIPTINTKVVFTHIPLVETNKVWSAYFGTKDISGNTNAFYTSMGSGNVSAFVGNVQVSNGNYPFSSTVGSTQVITLSASELKIVEDGVTKVSLSPTNTPTFTNPGELYIFARNANGMNYPGTFHVKSFQIYENDILQMDLVPVIDLDGIYCFYDNVSGEYLYNQGSGAFSGA